MPTLLHSIQWPYAFAGLLVGSLVGLTGVGVGSPMTPFLVLLFGVNPSTAVGTDLLFACLTKVAGMTLHASRGSVDWRIVGRLAADSVPATALAITLLGRHGAAGHAATTVLGIALMLTAVGIVFRVRIVASLSPRLEALGERGRLALTVGLGAVLGLLVAVSSVGAGATGVTVLFALYPRLPTVRIVGSEIGHAVPLTPVPVPHVLQRVELRGTGRQRRDGVGNDVPAGAVQHQHGMGAAGDSEADLLGMRVHCQLGAAGQDEARPLAHPCAKVSGADRSRCLWQRRCADRAAGVRAVGMGGCRGAPTGGSDRSSGRCAPRRPSTARSRCRA